MSRERTLFATPRTERARAFATQAHANQAPRKSGEPYIAHPEEVVGILSDWGIRDEALLCAGWLHDVLEDTDITPVNLTSEFGEDVVRLVTSVSHLSENSTRESESVLKGSYLDPRVAILKLADRLHNMRTLEFIPREKQLEKANETLRVYAALAESLGIWVVKTELEDLAFRYARRGQFESNQARIDSDPRLTRLFTSHISTLLASLLEEHSIPGAIEARQNGYWSTFTKKQRSAVAAKGTTDDFSHINDLVSFRVTVPTEEDCYQLLHFVHKHFGLSVDYDRLDLFMEANRRVNGYSAIQTTIQSNQGPIEIAITTREMEEFNNWGVLYLMRKGIRELDHYVLKLVYTPDGEIKFLNRDATGIDFAYAVNPQLGADAIHMEIITPEGTTNLPLSAVIPNAATVNIATGNARRAPDPSLLAYAGPHTRKRMEEQLLAGEKDRLIEKGKQEIESVLITRGLLDLSDVEAQAQPLLYRFGCQGWGDLYFKIGGGFVPLTAIAQALDQLKITKDALGLTTIRVMGKDQEGILATLSGWITAAHANIERVDLHIPDGVFHIRFVVRGLTPEQEGELTNHITSDPRFRSCTIA